MSYDNRLELQIDVNTAQGNAAIKQVNTNLSAFGRNAASAGSNAASGMGEFEQSLIQSRGEITHASHAAHLLGGYIGIELPRSVRRFIAESRTLGPILSSMFSGVAYVAIGIALFEAGKRLYEWITSTKEAEEATKKLREEQEKLNKSYEDFQDKLQAAQRVRAAAGLEGTRKGGIELGFTKHDLDKARIEFEALSAQYNRLYLDVTRPGYTKEDRDKRDAALVKLAEGKAEHKDVESQMLEAQQAHELIKVKYQTQGLELEKQITDEVKKQFELGMKQLALTQEIADVRVKELAAITEQNAKNLTDMEAFRAAADAAWIKSTGIVRNAQQLTPEQQVKAGEAEQQRKALEGIKIFRDNQDAAKKMADEAKRAFEQTANAIEGFIDRVFLTARSFADVWKQLWMQAAHYAVSQISRVLAASFMGVRGTAGATGGAEAGIGGGGSLASIAGGLLSPGSLGGYGGGGAGGSGAGGFGGLFNLGGLKSFIGLGGGGAHLQDTLASGGGGTFGTTMSGISHSNAFALGGGLLAMYGLKRGGLSGLAMTTAGGAMIGWKYGGWLGAGIGAGIGAIGGLIRLFVKGAQEKAREKIKACYGVDIKDKGVLAQIVEMAKQTYGGNLDMAIRSQEVRDLVELYAMSTGQGARGMPAKMTPVSLMQSGGVLSQLSPYRMPAGLPGSGFSGMSGGSGGGGIVIQLDGPATTRLLQGEAVTAIRNNGRTVSGAMMSATRQNAGRRELTSLQLSPGTLVS